VSGVAAPGYTDAIVAVAHETLRRLVRAASVTDTRGLAVELAVARELLRAPACVVAVEPWASLRALVDKAGSSFTCWPIDSDALEVALQHRIGAAWASLAGIDHPIT
jgi:hypothetical protein